MILSLEFMSGKDRGNGEERVWTNLKVFDC